MINSRVAAALLISVLLAACPEGSAIWVVEGSTRDRLEFGIGKSRHDDGGFGTEVVRVHACQGPSVGPGAAWIASQDTIADIRIKRVIYGEPPPGWITEEGPVPLTPGCYEADISGTGQTEFHVQADGSIVEKVE